MRCSARVAASAKYLSKGWHIMLLPHNSYFFFPRSHELIQEQEKQQMWIQPLQVSATLFLLFLPHPQCLHRYSKQEQLPRGSLGTSWILKWATSSCSSHYVKRLDSTGEPAPAILPASDRAGTTHQSCHLTQIHCLLWTETKNKFLII